MSSRGPGSTERVVNEPLRLLLSPQEIAFIEERIRRAKRQLRFSVLVPSIYFALLYIWMAHIAELGFDYQFVRFVTVAMLLSLFVVLGITVHLLLSGIIDWTMFARYRRDHRAFLNRYNRG